MLEVTPCHITVLYIQERDTFGSLPPFSVVERKLVLHCVCGYMYSCFEQNHGNNRISPLTGFSFTARLLFQQQLYMSHSESPPSTLLANLITHTHGERTGRLILLYMITGLFRGDQGTTERTTTRGKERKRGGGAREEERDKSRQQCLGSL